MASAAKVSVTMPIKAPKKRVVRYEVEEEQKDTAAISNVYVSNAVVKKLGNPDGIKITIEAA